MKNNFKNFVTIFLVSIFFIQNLTVSYSTEKKENKSLIVKFEEYRKKSLEFRELPHSAWYYEEQKDKMHRFSMLIGGAGKGDKTTWVVLQDGDTITEIELLRVADTERWRESKNYLQAISKKTEDAEKFSSTYAIIGFCILGASCIPGLFNKDLWIIVIPGALIGGSFVGLSGNLSQLASLKIDAIKIYSQTPELHFFLKKEEGRELVEKYNEILLDEIGLSQEEINRIESK